MILMIISIILDAVFSSFSNILFPLFTLVSLIIVYKTRKDFFKYSLIYGLIYGILFTNMFLLELISYYICSLFISYFFKNFKFNFLNCIVLTVLNITLYRIINFVLLVSCKTIKFNLFLLFKSIYSSILINIFYITILYFLFRKKSNKKNYKLYN